MTGTDLLLLVAICLLIYLAWKVGKIAPSAGKAEEDAEAKAAVEAKVTAMLRPSLIGKRCVVELKLDSVSLLDNYQTGKAVLLDYDEEWVLLEQGSEKRPFKRAIRISHIKSISELVW